MLKTVQTIAYWVMIISLVFLTLLAILSIWDIFDKDVFWKSIATIGVITFSSGIILIVTKNIEKNQNKPPQV